MKKQSIALLSIVALVTICGASAQAAPVQEQQMQQAVELIKAKQLVSESRFTKRTVNGRRDLDKVLILGGAEAFPM